MTGQRLGDEHGYAMAALLVALGVMSVMLTVLLPAWSTQAKREKEAELIFRGEQYARALRLYSQKYANALPPNVDALMTRDNKFLRKKYKDPMTGEDFVYVGPGAALPGMPGQTNPPGGTQRGAGSGQPGTGQPLQGQPGTGQRGAAAGPAGGRGTVTTGIAGVTSKSTETSLRLYNGRNKYNEWIFMPTQRATQAGGARGATQPGGVRGGLPGEGSQGRGGRGLQLPQGGRGGGPPGSGRR